MFRIVKKEGCPAEVMGDGEIWEAEECDGERFEAKGSGYETRDEACEDLHRH